MVLLMPVLLVALMFVVVAGRVGNTMGEVTGASRDAARAASQASSFGAAEQAALDTAAATLANRDVECANLAVTLDPTLMFEAGGRVSVTVRCEVRLSDLALPGLPGHRAVESTSTEVIDTYRWVDQ